MEQKRAVIKEMGAILGRRDSKEVLIRGNVANEEAYGRQSWRHTFHCCHPPESDSDDSADHQPGMRVTTTPGAQGSRGPATASFPPCPSSGSQGQRQSGDLVENGRAGQHAYLPKWGEGSGGSRGPSGVSSSNFKRMQKFDLYMKFSNV